MRRFRDISIRQKLMLIFSVVTVVVLSLTTGLLSISTWSSVRDSAAIELEGVAKLIGANSTAALVFGDEDGASDILETLETNPSVTFAALYDVDGERFSRYGSLGTNYMPEVSPEDVGSTVIDGLRVNTTQPVVHDGQTIGTIVLQSSLESRLSSLKQSLLPIIVILIAAFSIIMAFALKIAHTITDPVKRLSQLVMRISSEGQYNLRARIEQRDEIGSLADGINDMLGRIEQRDSEISAYSEKLEQQVHVRTADLEDANKRIQEELDEIARAEHELKEAHSNLELQHRNFTLLSEMNERLQVCNAVSDISPVVVHYMKRLFPESSGDLFTFNEERSRVESAAPWGSKSGSTMLFAQEECWALRQGRAHVIEDPSNGLICPHCSESDVRNYVCTPMVAYGELIGVLHVAEIEGDAISPMARQIMVSAAEHLAVAIANLRLREELQIKSIRDPLTGLFNRRYMQETLERELARSSREQSSVATLVLDIDHFKGFNDLYGHDAGDAVLREFAAFLQESIRAEDIACRYGGEEFVVIMPGAVAEAALQRAEQIREGIKEIELRRNGKPVPRINVSIGVSIFPEHGNNMDQLFSAADAALYEAKEEGRDRVKLAPTSQASSEARQDRRVVNGD